MDPKRREKCAPAQTQFIELGGLDIRDDVAEQIPYSCTKNREDQEHNYGHQDD